MAKKKAKSKKPDRTAYLRNKTRLAENFRDERQRERWTPADIKKVRNLCFVKNLTSIEVAEKFNRSLASIQGIRRKIIYLKELRLGDDSATMSEKILYDMVRKKRAKGKKK